MEEKEVHKELVNGILREVGILFREWDFDEINSIGERIMHDVIDDVKETSDYPNFNDSDIRISIKRVILCKLE